MDYYDCLCDLLYKEIEKYCGEKMGSVKKYYGVKQPYWNNELNGLWLNLRCAENTFLRCKNQSKRRKLQDEF